MLSVTSVKKSSLPGRFGASWGKPLACALRFAGASASLVRTRRNDMVQTIHSDTRRKLIAISLVLGSSGARGQVLDPDQLEALRLHIESFDTIDVIDPELRAIIERIGPTCLPSYGRRSPDRTRSGQGAEGLCYLRGHAGLGNSDTAA